MRITVPWRFELGIAIALGAILAIGSNAHATALCENSPALGCAVPCAHPLPIAACTFVGKPVGMGDVTVNGKASPVICYAYDGSTSVAVVVYDRIFTSGFNS